MLILLEIFVKTIKIWEELGAKNVNKIDIFRMKNLVAFALFLAFWVFEFNGCHKSP